MSRTKRLNQNTHFVLSNFFLENLALYEVMWKNIVERAIDDNVTHAHCMLDTSGYKYTQVVLLIAFPLPEWLYERA